MSHQNFLFTSESVTEGHPDKIADQISDGILDAIMAKDKQCRVACETILTTGLAFVAGEISTKAYVEIPDIIRQTIRDVGLYRCHLGVRLPHLLGVDGDRCPIRRYRHGGGYGWSG